MEVPVRKPASPVVSGLADVLDLGDGRRLAFVHTPGEGPGVLFCGGFNADMTGTKALALERASARAGRAFTRFDYTGHGASSGNVEDGAIGAWVDDALAIVDRITAGPLAVVGSSMGGWIMLHLALRRPDRIRGLVGVAAAPDFTEDLMWGQGTEEQRAALLAEGRWEQPSAYGDGPYVITRRLIEEGRDHLLLREPIRVACPVHLLHGQRDQDVPWQTALRLAERLESADVTIELIKAGDHRLSTPADIERICQATKRILARIDTG
jgi:pimeloyl-ACP methyl ester carboxylesterase